MRRLVVLGRVLGRALRRLLRWLLAYYRFQARCVLWVLGAFRIVPRPLAAALLRRIPPSRSRAMPAGGGR